MKSMKQIIITLMFLAICRPAFALDVTNTIKGYAGGAVSAAGGIYNRAAGAANGAISAVKNTPVVGRSLGAVNAFRQGNFRGAAGHAMAAGGQARGVAGGAANVLYNRAAMRYGQAVGAYNGAVNYVRNTPVLGRGLGAMNSLRKLDINGAVKHAVIANRQMQVYVGGAANFAASSIRNTPVLGRSMGTIKELSLGNMQMARTHARSAVSQFHSTVTNITIKPFKDIVTTLNNAPRLASNRDYASSFKKLSQGQLGGGLELFGKAYSNTMPGINGWFRR